jgi:hypothetical protein
MWQSTKGWELRSIDLCRKARRMLSQAWKSAAEEKVVCTIIAKRATFWFAPANGTRDLLNILNLPKVLNDFCDLGDDVDP